MPSQVIPLIKGDEVKNAEYRDALPVNVVSILRPTSFPNGYFMTYPGLVSFGTGWGIDRGAVFNERNNKHFRVSGTRFIEVDIDGTVTVLGNIIGTSQARLEGFTSFNTQGIIADGKMFLYDQVNGLVEVTDPDLGNPIDGVWINGYYFLTDGEYVYHTDIGDETAIDPLKYATAEFMPDEVKGVSKTQDNKVVVFGRYSIEYFTDIAQENFAFTRIESRAQKIGIIATHAKCEVANEFYIIGSRKIESISAYKVGLGSAVKIATKEIDEIISEYTESELADIRIESYTDKNTTFVLFHLPNHVLCFNTNFAQQFGLDYAWSILRSDLAGDDPYRAINGIFDPRIAKWIWGDKINTNIGELSHNTAKHYTDIVEWIIYTPFLYLETMSIDQLQLKTIPGFNISDDAQIAISSTFDGQAYSLEQWFNTGAPLDYTKRFIIFQLGYVSHFVGFKLRGVSQSKMAIANMEIIFS